jgi:hypothetical protein
MEELFVFAPDGSVPCCVMIAPSCIHDSTLSDFGDIYDKLQHLYETCNVKNVVDSLFSLSAGEFVKSVQDDPNGAAQLLENKEATAVRQLSKWGMRQIQSKFPRMTDTLNYEERGCRKLDLNLRIRLYNHNVRRIGMNQILDSEMPEKSAERRYYLDTDRRIDATADGIADSLINTNI